MEVGKNLWSKTGVWEGLEMRLSTSNLPSWQWSEVHGMLHTSQQACGKVLSYKFCYSLPLNMVADRQKYDTPSSSVAWQPIQVLMRHESLACSTWKLVWKQALARYPCTATLLYHWLISLSLQCMREAQKDACWRGYQTERLWDVLLYWQQGCQIWYNMLASSHWLTWCHGINESSCYKIRHWFSHHLQALATLSSLAEGLAKDAGLIEVTVACRHLLSVDRGRALKTSMPISDLWPTCQSRMSVQGPLH